MKQQRIVYHKDGSIWAKGDMVDGECDGYWEWFRKDGSKMRSGYSNKNEQIGEWTTYDKRGHVYKKTLIKPKKVKKHGKNSK